MRTVGRVYLLASVLWAGGISVEAGEGPQVATAAPCGEIDVAPFDRWRLYHLPEGSEIFPSTWLAAMKSQNTGKPFLDGLDRFGLLADPEGPEVRGDDGQLWTLPVGMTLAKPPNSSLEMVGVNCAACHVGEVRIGEKTIRIDGAPNLFNLDAFYEEMFESAKATVANVPEFVAFLNRLKRARVEGDEFSAFFDRLGEGLAKNDPLCRAVVERAKAVMVDPDVSNRGRLGLLGAAHTGGLDAAVKQIIDRDQQFTDRLKSRFPDIMGIKALRGDLVKKSDLPGSLGEALSRVGDDRLLFLEARLAFLKRLRGLHDAPEGQKSLVPGPGRIDAIINARDLVFPDDAINPNSAVSYPPLWGLRQIAWFHYDGDTTSLMDRNMAQSMGLGAVVIKETGASTIIPRNLHELEILNGRLEPPRWTDRVGPLAGEESLRAQGASLYKKSCAACHDFKPGDSRPLLHEETRPFGFPVYDVGSDPQRVKNFAKPMKDGRMLAPVLQETLAGIKKTLYKTNHISSAEQATMEPKKGSKWVTTYGYVARPLHGVWATAPYLHNGSVPTLDDLLKPAADRPKTFLVGYRVYDPERLGYVSDPMSIPANLHQRLFIFDTNLVGNKNSGHEYGSKLSDADRKALLAYLKTL